LTAGQTSRPLVKRFDRWSNRWSSSSRARRPASLGDTHACLPLRDRIPCPACSGRPRNTSACRPWPRASPGRAGSAGRPLLRPAASESGDALDPPLPPRSLPSACPHLQLPAQPARRPRLPADPWLGAQGFYQAGPWALSPWALSSRCAGHSRTRAAFRRRGCGEASARSGRRPQACATLRT
jgi:hypothetical protein